MPWTTSSAVCTARTLGLEYTRSSRTSRSRSARATRLTLERALPRQPAVRVVSLGRTVDRGRRGAMSSTSIDLFYQLPVISSAYRLIEANRASLNRHV